MQGGYCNNLTNYSRRLTNSVSIGRVSLGSDFPIRIQSMANTNTSNVINSVEQCIRIIKAGADYVRFAVISINDIKNIADIKRELLQRGFNAPIIADVHFNAEIATKVAGHVEKIRINPGNFVNTRKSGSLLSTVVDYQRELMQIRNELIPLLEVCRTMGVALRIGVNHGSLSERIMERYGDTPVGMAESAMEFLRICAEMQFDQVVVSMKASNIRVMVQATRLVVKMMQNEGMHFPLHLGVTEAGEGEDGRIKSAAGIGALLADGLGDTIRVSLTEDPEAEIPVARKIVDHIQQISNHIPLPEIDHHPCDPYNFTGRISRVTGKIGGYQVPVVIGEIQPKKADYNKSVAESMVDYFFVNSLSEAASLPDCTGIIMPYSEWILNRSDHIYPLSSALQYTKNSLRSTQTNLVNITITDLDESLIRVLEQDMTTVIVYQCTNANIQAELRRLYYLLEKNRCKVPVIIRLMMYENNPENFRLKSAALLGGTFIDGFGDGLWLSNIDSVSYTDVISASFGILQACRVRMSRTEYISCPSCGRTQFNLIKTLAMIKSATSHLRGLKIGVMGCIVNGPGEMADADYGYVGAGKGKISLYKGKKIIRHGIPEENAVNELVNLIKESGDWAEP
jgi:(E)-4-hydroxy-3-methylbut-2-enyl-diphosphate synthase